MKKSSKYILIVLILFLLSFEFANIIFSDSKYSGNYQSNNVEKIQKRSIRYGSVLKDEITYPIVFVFQDLIIILVAVIIGVVLLSEKKEIAKEIKKMKKLSYNNFLLLSIVSVIIFIILLGFSNYYSIKINKQINEWGVYYITHAVLMISALLSSIFAFKVGERRNIRDRDPKFLFFILSISYAIQGIIIGIMDASFTRESGTFGSILPALILSYMLVFFISLKLIYFIAASHKLKFNSFFKYATTFYIFVYSAGLWFLAWHISIGQSIFKAYLQHPLPYRFWPIAIYWESWMDPWLMWVTLGFFIIYTGWMIKKISTSKD